MSLGNPSSKRALAALSGVAAASLAVVGLTLVSTPTEAAPSAAAPTVKKGYAGAPVNPSPYTLTQPDGSTLRVHGFGDHLSHGVATVKGNYTLVKAADGFWRYASGLTASGKLKPSGVVAGQGAPPQAAQDLAPAPSAKATQAQTPPAGTGDDKELVILVQFTDMTSRGSTPAQWHDHYFGASGSVDKFYNEASQDQFGLAPATETCGTANDGVTDWISLPYAHPNTGVVSSATEDYVADAIEATDSCVNYGSYDTDANGQITTDELHITVIGAGYETSFAGANVCGKSIWGHEWDLGSAGITPPVVDGVTVGKSGYTTFGEWHCKLVTDTPGHKATIGIMAHEFGHDINWPDLYDTDGSGEGIGEFSLMAGGSWGDDGGFAGNSPAWPDAWAKYYQGWITPTPVTSATNDLQVAPNHPLLLNPNAGGSNWVFNETEGDGEYYLIENRNHTGFDISTPACGLIVYRVDETVTPSNSANNSSTDPLIKVIQADGLDELTTGHNDRGDAGDPYPGSTNNHDLTNTSTPNSKFHDGSASNLALHVDSAAGCLPNEQVDITTPGVASPAVVRPGNDMFANAVTITGDSGSVTGNTQHATVEAGEPKPADAGRASVWYRWTPTATGTATVTMADSDYDTVLGLYTGSAVNALVEVGANDDEVPGSVFTSKVTAHVTAGTTYQVAADGYGGDSGALELAWSLVADPTPTPTPTPTATPTKVATSTTAQAPKKVKFKKNFDVKTSVAASGGSATGTVQVLDGSKVIGTGTLANGAVSIHITKNLKSGKHTLTVTYAGSTTTLASQTTVKVKVLKKKRHHH